jgi:hypothetical protein
LEACHRDLDGRGAVLVNDRNGRTEQGGSFIATLVVLAEELRTWLAFTTDGVYVEMGAAPLIGDHDVGVTNCLENLVGDVAWSRDPVRSNGRDTQP